MRRNRPWPGPAPKRTPPPKPAPNPPWNPPPKPACGPGATPIGSATMPEGAAAAGAALGTAIRTKAKRVGRSMATSSGSRRRHVNLFRAARRGVAGRRRLAVPLRDAAFDHRPARLAGGEGRFRFGARVADRPRRGPAATRTILVVE